MTIGIKQKILLVLIGVLVLTAVLCALLASYYTNQQNQKSAFAGLNRDLVAWQNDVQALTLRLKGAALSTVGDPVLLNQLAELATLEFNADAPLPAKEVLSKARTLSYVKAISLNRLRLALRTDGFSNIAVYTRGKLSHSISASEAGMMVRREYGHPVWVAAADADGNLDFQSWPAWREGQPPATLARIIARITQPTVFFTFPSPEFAAIEIAVPVQGDFIEDWSHFLSYPLWQLVSTLTIATPARNLEQDKGASGMRRETAAILVFRKRIDRAVLDDLAAKTGKWPVLFSPEGSHRQWLTDAHPTPRELLQKAQAVPPGKSNQIIQQIVTTGEESFYEALLPFQFEGQTRLILGLTSSRDSTLQNIRQTVTAILIAAALILVLSIALGTFWIGRFIDPIVALTGAVRRIGIKRDAESAEIPEGVQSTGNRITAEQLQPIAVKAPDEIGELSDAFNVMIAELRDTMETLEQRVQARTAELRQQTLYLRTLIDTLPLWIWLKDIRHVYLATNRANAEACGRTVDEMIGASDNALRPPEVAERYRTEDDEVIVSRRRKTVEECIEGTGGTVWMETCRAPVLDEDGTVLGIVGAAQNISERKAAEEAREQALAEAMRLARHRSEFLAQMSHELRTPLNAILGYAQILQRDKQHLTARQSAGLATIQASGQHLLTLINDILDLARVEAGKLALYPADTDLAMFLRVVADVIRIKAEEKSLLFTYVASPDLPVSVEMDDKRLRQVLLNLLGNAVKFTDSGEVVLRVHRMAPPVAEGARESIARLRFEVQDSGIGMSGEQLAHLFQSFEQVGEVSRREGGTGLGLAISQQLVRLMGGTIQVRSEAGLGSLFWFDLDLPIGSGVAAIRRVSRVITGYEGRRRKVLVVDDVPQNRALLMDALQPLGFDVVDAANGQECLDLLDSIKPDLILMDVMMPVMDGREATRRIRALAEFDTVPIVIVSASVRAADEAKSRAAGASACLPKPVDHDSLLMVIGEQLSLKWIEAPLQERAAVTLSDTEEFIVPPQDEIEKLYRVARLGLMQEIRTQAEHLKRLDARYAPFSARLQTLAENYQSKAIVALMERYHTGQGQERPENPQV